jgi:hypothetical protein
VAVYIHIYKYIYIYVYRDEIKSGKSFDGDAEVEASFETRLSEKNEVCIGVCMCVCVYTPVCEYICVCICDWIYTNICMHKYVMHLLKQD